MIHETPKTNFPLFTYLFIYLKNSRHFICTKKKTKTKTENMDEASTHADHSFMGLMPWKSYEIMGVMMSFGGSKRNWQVSDSEKQ